MKTLFKGKHGGMTDLFLFMIFAFVIIFISGIMIYIGLQTRDKLDETLGQMPTLHDTQGNNATEVIAYTMGEVNLSFEALHWIAVFLIFGMIFSIFIGSYLVTTKPIFFVPYLFIVIIAIISSVPMANTYEVLLNDATLGATFTEFTGANFVMLNLPIFITIVGMVGGIIMFTRMGRREEVVYG
jgi:hypothetical protein